MNTAQVLDHHVESLANRLVDVGFGTRFHKVVPVFFGIFSPLSGRHLSFIFFVNFIANEQNFRTFFAFFFNEILPVAQIFKGFSFRNVINQNDAMSLLIV